MHIPTDITRLLENGDNESMESLFPIVYEELRTLAGSLFRGEFRENHTLQPTALVHEAFLRLVADAPALSCNSRAHFFGIAARSMRQILVNHAVARKAEKRGGGQTLLALDEAIGFLKVRDLDLLEIDDALQKLSGLDDRHARIVELRFFAGLTIDEVAAVLAISPATVKRDWEMARAWLYRELKG